MGKMATRVAIARDVLRQLEAKRFHVKVNNAYVRELKGYSELQRRALRAKRYGWLDVTLEHKAIDAFGGIPSLEDPIVVPEKCEVCAKGALFVSAVDKHNELYLKDTGGDIDDSICVDYLSRWFSENDLNLFEIIFEYRSCGEIDSDISDKRADQINAFRERAWNRSQKGTKAERLLRAMMNNIIRNEGRFKIDQ